MNERRMYEQTRTNADEVVHNNQPWQVWWSNEWQTNDERMNDEQMMNERRTNNEQTTNKRQTNDEEFAQLLAIQNQLNADSSASDTPPANELIVASAHSSGTPIDSTPVAEEEGSV